MGGWVEGYWDGDGALEKSGERLVVLLSVSAPPLALPSWIISHNL